MLTSFGALLCYEVPIVKVLDRNQLEHLLKLAIHKLLFVWQSEFGRASASVKIALAKRIASRLGFGLMRTTSVTLNIRY